MIDGAAGAVIRWRKFKDKEDMNMTIMELYVCLQPVTSFLGTICLLALVSGGIIFAIAWIIKNLWKYILACGAVAFVLFSAVLALSTL